MIVNMFRSAVCRDGCHYWNATRLAKLLNAGELLSNDGVSQYRTTYTRTGRTRKLILSHS